MMLAEARHPRRDLDARLARIERDLAAIKRWIAAMFGDPRLPTAQVHRTAPTLALIAAWEDLFPVPEEEETGHG